MYQNMALNHRSELSASSSKYVVATPERINTCRNLTRSSNGSGVRTAKYMDQSGANNLSGSQSMIVNNGNLRGARVF